MISWALTRAVPFGLGHAALLPFSSIARQVWFLIAKKYFRYLLALLGIWTNDVYNAFSFSTVINRPVDQTVAEFRRAFADELEAIIATRALVLLMCPGAFATAISMYATHIGDCPFYFLPDNKFPVAPEFIKSYFPDYHDKYKYAKIGFYSMAEDISRNLPLFITNAIKISREREMERTGLSAQEIHDKGEYWIIYLKSFRVYANLSRAVRYFIR